MGAADRVRGAGGGSVSDCVDEGHFSTLDGVVSPQPWMQWRPVGSVAAASKTATYGVTGGGNKNTLIHSLQRSWTNQSPIDQWVYGLISRGGCRVTLQARSRGWLSVLSGFQQHPSDAGVLVEASRMGIGADIGRSGVLGLGTSFCVAEQRQNSVTIPLAPERVGWWRLPAGASLTAKVEVRFVTEFWENTIIDGGNSGAESGYESGDTRLDLFAVPVIE